MSDFYKKLQAGVWLDSRHAIIVILRGEDCMITEVTSNLENRVYHYGEGNKGTFKEKGQHHNDETKYEERRKHQIAHYIKDIISHLEKPHEVLIMGPAEARVWLKEEILLHPQLRDKLMAVEPAGKMTINQLLAKVKVFFNGKQTGSARTLSKSGS